MRNSFFFLVVSCLFLTGTSTAQADQINSNEVTFVVEMTINDKSPAQIEQFSEFYQKLVKKNEPETLGWLFYSTDPGKVTVIERYASPEAAMQHVKNIMPGGIAEAEFGEFAEHFIIEKINVYGSVTEEWKKVATDLALNFDINPLISGYSRNQEQ